jgi:hypothetical protein
VALLRRVEYLSKFSPAPSTNPASFGGQLVERMAARVMVFFMRHASLVRPLSSAGKVQLAKVLSPPHTFPTMRPAVATAHACVIWPCALLMGQISAEALMVRVLELESCGGRQWAIDSVVSAEGLYNGECRRAQDIAELEAAVAENLVPLEAVGPPHRALRAFRPLLFLDTAALPDSLLLQALPPSVVLHHLYSRSPPALQSPHAHSGFSPAQVPIHASL